MRRSPERGTGDRLSSGDLPSALRDDLIALLLCDSADTCSADRRLAPTEPGNGHLMADLEVDDDLRARFDMELLRTSTK